MAANFITVEKQSDKPSNGFYATPKMPAQQKDRDVTPGDRLKRLRELLEVKPIVRTLEVHNGLTGLIVENTNIEENGEAVGFDAMWLSSLTDSTAKGKPDIEYVDITSRMNTLHDILDVTTKPIILDGDTGGLVEHFVFTVRTLERLGISAIIIEDKVGLKKNSLFGTDVAQTQDDVDAFAHKIISGKNAQVTDEFMIIARIESLILGAGVNDAVTRARAYIAGGADAIMIHSKDRDTTDLFEFCEIYRAFDEKRPLVAVPSAYSHVTEQQLMDAGVQVVIYANHLLRSAYPAMTNTAQTILQSRRALEVEEYCMPISEILTLIPGAK